MSAAHRQWGSRRELAVRRQARDLRSLGPRASSAEFAAQRAQRQSSSQHQRTGSALRLAGNSSSQNSNQQAAAAPPPPPPFHFHFRGHSKPSGFVVTSILQLPPAGRTVEMLEQLRHYLHGTLLLKLLGKTVPHPLIRTPAHTPKSPLL